MGILKKLWGRLSGAPDSCFIACDVSDKTLEEHPAEIVQGMAEFFGDMLHFDAQESIGLNTVRAQPHPSAVREWFENSVQRRKAYLPLPIIPTEIGDIQILEAFLRRQRWVLGWQMTGGAMTDTYAMLLNSLRQQISLSSWVPGTDDIWRCVTITLGPVPSYSYNAHEPMNVATQIAARAGLTVVVAVGNEGQITQGNSLSPWSMAPWVIGVGACDESGSDLMDTSSRGTSSSHGAPTVVAPGSSSNPLAALDHGHQVAFENVRNAPANTMETTIVGEQVYMYTKAENGKIFVSVIRDGQESIRAPLEDIQKWMKAQNMKSDAAIVTGTSFAAEYVAAVCGEIAIRVKELDLSVALSMRPQLVKRMLEDIAVPLGNRPPWEVGRGLVTMANAKKYLARVGKDRVTELCNELASKSTTQAQRAMHLRTLPPVLKR